jgi:hypothetical protein
MSPGSGHRAIGARNPLETWRGAPAEIGGADRRRQGSGTGIRHQGPLILARNSMADSADRGAVALPAG